MKWLLMLHESVRIDFARVGRLRTRELRLRLNLDSLVARGSDRTERGREADAHPDSDRR